MKKFINSLKKIDKYLLTIFGFALLLRLIGINNGYPFIYSIDEPTVIRSTLGLFFTSDIDHFDWPHFGYYFNFVFYFIFIKLRGLVQILGFQPFIQNWFPQIWSDPYIFYFISRLNVAILGALTIYPIFYFTNRYFKNKKMAYLSAIFIGFMPLHLMLSRYTMQDVPMLFWGSMFVYFAYLSATEGKIRYYILSGVFLALSAGGKYNAVLFVLLLPMFLVIKDNTIDLRNIVKSFKTLIIFSLSLAITFLITNYRIVVDWGLFWSYEYGRGFLWQLTENSNPLALYEYPAALFKRTINLIWVTGITPFILMIISIILVIKDQEMKLRTYVLLIFILFNILFISRYERASSHYYVIIFGIISSLAALSTVKLEKYLNKLSIYLLVFIPFIIVNGIFLGKALGNDTRQNAYDFVINKPHSEIYYKGNNISEFNMVNNLSIKKYDNEESFLVNTYIVSNIILNIDGFRKIKEIDDINRNGNKIYIYAN